VARRGLRWRQSSCVVGVGVLFPPSYQLAMRGVTHRDAGITSAVVNAAAQVGSSVGAALVHGYAAAMLVMIRTTEEKS